MRCCCPSLYLPRISARERTSLCGWRRPAWRGRLSLCVLRACRIKESAYGGDAIGRKTYTLGVFMDGRLVRGEVDAVHLVAGYVTMEPLNLWTHSPQNADRLLRDFPQLCVGQLTSSRNFAFDDELGHGPPPGRALMLPCKWNGFKTAWWKLSRFVESRRE